MYLWIVIATFMVALISFNLSVRPDADRAYMETRASAIITKFRIQHNAFKDYVYSLRLPKDSAESTVVYTSGLAYKNGTLSAGTYGTNGGAQLNAKDVEDYMPVGFEPTPNIYSKVFCFKMASYEIDQDYAQTCEQETGKQFCCADSLSFNYIVSWQKIPTRWMGQNGKPISDMMTALSNAEGYGQSIGYIATVENIDHPVISGGAGMAVDMNLGKRVLKYQPVFTAVTNDADYQEVCKENLCFIAINKVQNREE